MLINRVLPVLVAHLDFIKILRAYLPVIFYTEWSFYTLGYFFMLVNILFVESNIDISVSEDL